MNINITVTHATAHTHNLSFTAAFGSSTYSLRVVTDPVTNESDFSPLDNRTAVSLGSTIGPPLLRCVGSNGGRTGSMGLPILISVVWVRNGEQVVGGGRITITESPPYGVRRQSDLQISNFGFSDVGVYQCIFTVGYIEVITTTPLRLDTGWC